MASQLQISAKILGELAMPNFCPRCFWIKLHLNNKLPFQIFPGIFSSIDSYTKNVVHGWFNKYNCSPPWLKELGNIIGYVEPPGYRRFNIYDKNSDILLTGTPDAVFTRTDKTHVIADYKTARHTGVQDSLLPMYEVQLNVYALIGEQRGLKPVSSLALIYMEPVTDQTAASDNANLYDSGFRMGFTASIQTVNLNPNSIPPLLKKARDIYEMDTAPEGGEGCSNCLLLFKMLDLASKQ